MSTLGPNPTEKPGPTYNSGAAETSSSDTDHDRDEGTSDVFFGCLLTQQKRRKFSNADRVETSLSAVPPKSIDAKSFDDEGLKKLFIQYNTTLPSSAAVERLFSLGEDILKPNAVGSVTNTLEC